MWCVIHKMHLCFSWVSNLVVYLAKYFPGHGKVAFDTLLASFCDPSKSVFKTSNVFMFCLC